MRIHWEAEHVQSLEEGLIQDNCSVNRNGSGDAIAGALVKITEVLGGFIL